MITLDDESTTNNCKVTEGEVHASLGVDVNSALQVVFKFSKHFAVSMSFYNSDVY